MVFSESGYNRSEALKREISIKKLSRKEKTVLILNTIDRAV
jgi:predicted GIY-YIG superfamily endonuclease